MKIILPFLILALAFTGLHAQDLSFSQFYDQPLLRNPALAGVFEGDIRVTGAFRNQWQSISVPFQTSSLGLEYKIPFNQQGDWLTLGMQATQDAAGDIKLKRTQLLPVLNFHKSLSQDENNYLSLAFMGGPVNSQFDPGQLKMSDQFIGGQYNPSAQSQTFTRTGFTYWDASVGLSYSGSYGENIQYYAGAGLFHLNKPKVNFYTSSSNVELQSKLSLNGGLTVHTGDLNRLVFYADYFRQGGTSQAFAGGLYAMDLAHNYEGEKIMTLSMGAFYRWNDALVPVIRTEWHNLNVGLSYDVNVSRLKTASQYRGGFELTIGYRARLSRRNPYADAMQCVSGF